MNLSLRTSPSGIRSELTASLVSYGSQPAWVIDPVLGNDNNVGTLAAPLRTMGEFNSRWAGLAIRVAATLTLLGSVIDEPLTLSGTRFLAAGSLTLSGTRSILASGITISAVTVLGGNPLGTAYPWQITTVGYNWTTHPPGAQIRFSNSTVAFAVQIIDANNVVVEPTTSIGVSTIPTTSLTFSIESLVSALPPVTSGCTVNATGSQVLSPVVCNDLSFNSGGCSLSGIGVQLVWCEIKSGTQLWDLDTFMRWIGCRVTMATGSTFRLRSSPHQLIVQSSVFVGDAGASPIFYVLGGQVRLNSCAMQNSRPLFGDNSYILVSSGLHMRNVSAAPVRVESNATVEILNSTNGSLNGGGGASGGTNVGVAITVTFGRFIYPDSASKPTMTATAGQDVRLGATTTLSYATIGTGRLLATVDGTPPALTGVNLIGAGSASFGQIV